ncbi:MAG: class E sortase [Streptosporangiaceae bacterium]
MRLCLRVSGELLSTLGVVVLGFLAYMYWGTALRTSAAQHAFASELTSQWSGASELAALTGPAKLALGEPFALLRIPQLGPSWQFAVVQGTGLTQLALAPGHLPGSALPGQVGNFVIAGHRVTAGNPFWRLPSLHAGSLIIVVTINASYEYEVTGRPRPGPADDTAVTAPVPYHTGERARLRMITLITSDPPWTGTSRVVVTGVLVRALPRQPGS